MPGKRPVNDRFDEKVSPEPMSGCFLWTAYLMKEGYGLFTPVHGKHVLAHRFAYAREHGAIPAGLTLDHICRNRACVNPQHLEPVTHRVNILRGSGASARNIRKTTCPRGHTYNSTRANGWRTCLTCNAAYQRALRWKRRG